MSDPRDPVVRKTVSLTASVWRRIEDYQFTKRVKRDAEAIRQLIELGLVAGDAIRIYSDRNNPAIYGFVPEDSPGVLPVTGHDWRPVPGAIVRVTPTSATWTAIREGISAKGYHLIDSSNAS